MSIEQVTDHVFRQMTGDPWCVVCGMPKPAHLFHTDEEKARHDAAQRCDPDEAEAFNRSVAAKAAAGDPVAVALIASFSTFRE